jgi:NagD protein
MDTDVRCGLEAELDTLLVMSGITKREDIDKFPYRPQFVLNGVIDLV